MSAAALFESRLRPSGHCLRDFENFFGIQNLIVTLEKLSDTGTVQCQFQRTEANGSPNDFSVSVCSTVHHIGPADTDWRSRVGIRHQLDRRIILPMTFFQQFYTGCAGRKHYMRLLYGFPARVVIMSLNRGQFDAEPLFHVLASFLGASHLA